MRWLLLLMSAATVLLAARLKDIATIEGVHGLPLVGYGLVTGLNQTGDSPRSAFTVQSVVNMLQRFGVHVSPLTLRTRNVAAVMVTAVLPPFAKPGTRIDVQVSSLGDAESLQGGVLLLTPLAGPDGTIYALAQGAVSVGGYEFRALGTRALRNFVATGRVPSGALVEREFSPEIVRDQQVRVLLHQPDFSVAQRVADAISRLPGLSGAVSVVDAATVAVRLPAGTSRDQHMRLLAQLEALQVTPDAPARVVINERTGTVVVGGQVQLLPAVVAHGGLEVVIQRQVIISQPQPLTLGRTEVAETATITVQPEQRQAVVLPAAAAVQDVASALNALGVSPRDLIAILQALKEAGALTGELIIQ
ncbi:MAG: flagellar basal body P-ring protein FlgI [Chlorobiota bacterium]